MREGPELLPVCVDKATVRRGAIRCWSLEPVRMGIGIEAQRKFLPEGVEHVECPDSRTEDGDLFEGAETPCLADQIDGIASPHGGYDGIRFRRLQAGEMARVIGGAECGPGLHIEDLD